MTEHSGQERGRWPAWATPMVLCLITAAVLLPFDGWILIGARRIDARIGGDARRVLDWLQEYGQGAAVVLVGLLIWTLDPPRRRALLRGLLIAAVTAAACFALKMLIGRPRPKFGEPLAFVGPWGTWPIGPDGTARHPWEVWRNHQWELWSMPSSHTAYAAATSVFLATLYPPLRRIVFVLAAVVGACRVLNGAHYPSDVVVGAGIGVTAARAGLIGLKDKA